MPHRLGGCRESTVTRVSFVTQISGSTLSVQKSFWCLDHLSCPGVEREAHTQVISFIIVNVPYKLVPSILLLELLHCLLFIKNNQLKITLMLKRHHLGCLVLLPSTTEKVLKLISREEYIDVNVS